MNWIKTSEEQPKNKQWCYGLRNRTNWISGNDTLHHVVVKFVKGLSKEDRTKMKNGELPDPTERVGTCPGDKWVYEDVKKSSLYSGEDEHGNNLVPYNWDTFGPGTFFGQEIEYWKPLDEMPEEFIKKIALRKKAEKEKGF